MFGKAIERSSILNDGEKKMKNFKHFSIKNVSKSFAEKKALDNFNLEIKQGEFITFLGPSGCGKSTALNCIAGLIPITSGNIYIDDECIDDGLSSMPPEKRGFGMVFQNYALFPHLSVFNNIAFGLQLKKLDKTVIQEKVQTALKMVHLEGYDNKLPGQMSGGEQQRVAIARCIVMEPRLLMLDEPLSNLDAKLRIDMRYELKDLHERLQITSIYVTHDQQEALALSDRIVVMRMGRIQQVGTAEQIYSQPSNLFVADFMGFRNLWEARVESLVVQNDFLEAGIDVGGLKLLVRNPFNPGYKTVLEKAMRTKEKVYTAIRPEDITLGGGAANTMTCQVDVVEYLGQVSQISAKLINGLRVDLRPNDRARSGEQITIGVQPEKILLFPKEEG
jgi:putative spermidine/putrescine transport system ATP-binding protein